LAASLGSRTVRTISRTTLFTGRHSGQFVKLGLDGENLNVGQNFTTLAMLLRSAGYTTGAFGKTAPLESPVEQGFDRFLGQLSQLYCHNMYPA
jgi:arylsulfatase A-like enzyme